MTNNFISEAKIITSNKFLIQKYHPLLELSTGKSIQHRLNILFAKAHYRIFNMLYPNRPWTSPGSVLFFDKVLNNTMVGLEYGSGQSTIYFAKKLKKLVSIEHYEEWFNKVNKLLIENNIQNVDYLFIPKENFPSDKKDLDDYKNEHNKYESRKNFMNYYNKVNEYPNDFFDFVLIDGRARVHCGLNSMKKLKKGGIFVLDNSERERYTPLHEALESWPKVYTTNGFTDTTIWFKP